MSLRYLVLKDRKELVQCASGKIPADIVIRNGRWVCVQSGEIVPGTDVAILGERIAYVGANAEHTIGPDTLVLDAADGYLTPGLLDGHMHVESGMMTVTDFTHTVIPHGTTGMFVDPHEIGNVFGIEGVRYMVEEALQQPIHVFVQVPSCVPSAPGLETSGAEIGAQEVKEAMEWDGIAGLGEVMNYPGVIQGDEKMHQEIDATYLAGKVVGGHFPSEDTGIPFHAYVAGGAQDDHEATTLEGAVARVRQGMRLMMRYGSAWHDVAVLVKAVTEMGLDPRHFILCTDDSHSQTLYTEGHMDRVVRHAIAQGLSPMHALQMATINTAEYFGVSSELGQIAPGRFADILLVRNLVSMDIEWVMGKGRILAQNGKMLNEVPLMKRPAWILNSVHLKRTLTKEDFRLSCHSNSNPIIAHVIGVIENQAPTRHLKFEVIPQHSEVKAEVERDIAKIAIIERHHGKGSITVGLVHGFGFNCECAIASTVAHDCHHLVVVGTEDANMAVAVNELARIEGGQIVVRNGEVIAQLSLPIAGLMSDEPAEIVSRQAAQILEGFKACGCTLNNPNMQLSLLGLVVIPQLRISDLGLVDVEQFKFIPVIEETSKKD